MLVTSSLLSINVFTVASSAALCPGRRVGSRKKPVSRLHLHGDLSTSRVCRGIRGRIHASLIPPAQDVAFCAGGWMPPGWLGAPTPSSVCREIPEGATDRNLLEVGVVSYITVSLLRPAT